MVAFSAVLVAALKFAGAAAAVYLLTFTVRPVRGGIKAQVLADGVWLRDTCHGAYIWMTREDYNAIPEAVAERIQHEIPERAGERIENEIPEEAGERIENEIPFEEFDPNQYVLRPDQLIVVNEATAKTLTETVTLSSMTKDLAETKQQVQTLTEEKEKFEKEIAKLRKKLEKFNQTKQPREEQHETETPDVAEDSKIIQ